MGDGGSARGINGWGCPKVEKLLKVKYVFFEHECEGYFCLYTSQKGKMGFTKQKNMLMSAIFVYFSNGMLTEGEFDTKG